LAPEGAIRDRRAHRRIDAHEASIGIIGQGYVGLPLALTFVEKGVRVLGLDVDAEKVAALNRGECYIRHVDAVRVKRARDTKRFEATADFTRLGEPDATLICVPTPLTLARWVHRLRLSNADRHGDDGPTAHRVGLMARAALSHRRGPRRLCVVRGAGRHEDRAIAALPARDLVPGR
jgi:hypothetical protein